MKIIKMSLMPWSMKAGSEGVQPTVMESMHPLSLKY